MFASGSSPAVRPARRRSAFATTDAELRLIACAAIMGDSSQPERGSSTIDGGAVFIDEDERAGAGVRLKFNRGDVRAIRRLEGEGGATGEDDVC
jgi:hypothetical protein